MSLRTKNLTVGEAKKVRAQDTSLSITREKHRLGAAYGMAAGISFAFGLWTWDAIQLSGSHAFFPWLKLFLGILLCGFVGGMAGWLVARKDSGLFSFAIWLVAAGVLSWITVGLPLQIIPAVAKSLVPELDRYLDYAIGTGFVTRYWLALVLIFIFLSLTGLLQLTLVDSAVFSTSGFGWIAPFFVCIGLMATAGFVIDDLINVPFRKAIASGEVPIQFVLDHRGVDVDPALSRKNHAGSLRGVLDVVTQSRLLIISSYDDNFVLINVLVHFQDSWVNCTTVNAQSSYCAFAEPNP